MGKAPMAKGTSAGFFGTRRAPAVLKHELLRDYIAPFLGMTGSTNAQGRAVFLDGYAGVGRYEDGSPGSPLLALELAKSMLPGRTLDCVFVEKERKSFESLKGVVEQYQADGVTCAAFNDEVENRLTDVVAKAKGVPLLFFLDPCGVGVSYQCLVAALTGPRLGAYPATEVLLNFNTSAVRRIGGQLAVTIGNRSGVGRLDDACDGDWWHAPYLEAMATENIEQGVEAVVAGFAERLGRDTKSHVVCVPVRSRPGLVPIYNLVFTTRSSYGLWVFGDAAAKAQQKWRAAQFDEEPDDPMDAGLLFGTDQILADREARLKIDGTAAIRANLLTLLTKHAQFKVLDHVREVFGIWYGIARETWVRDAVKQLHTENLTTSTGIGGKPRELVVMRP